MNFKACHAPAGACDSRAGRIAAHVAGGLALAAVHAIVFGWVLAFLWNRILPDLFGLRAITYWQSVGLLVMARILVGGLHGGRGRRRRHRPGPGPWQDYEAWWREEGRASFQSYADRERPGAPEA